MITKEIHAGLAFTKSLPNYQNIKPTAEVTIGLEPGDTEEEAFAKAWDMCSAEIWKQLKAFEDTKPGQIKKGF